MAKDKKKTDLNEMSAYTKEDAYQNLEMTNTWISNIDTKVSFAMAFVGVLIGVIFEMGFPRALQRVCEVSHVKELKCEEILGVILVCLLYVVGFASIVSFMFAIIARTKNLNNVSSIFFFGSIGKMDLQSYKEKINKMTEQQIIEDLAEQIHTNASICSQKIRWYNQGTKFLMATIILWFICVLFRLI